MGRSANEKKNCKDEKSMKKRRGHGKRVQNNPKNSHVNNIIITRVTVICLEKIQKKTRRTASMNLWGVKIRTQRGVSAVVETAVGGAKAARVQRHAVLIRPSPSSVQVPINRALIDRNISFIVSISLTNALFCTKVSAHFTNSFSEKHPNSCLFSEEITVHELLSIIHELLVIHYIILCTLHFSVKIMGFPLINSLILWTFIISELLLYQKQRKRSDVSAFILI